MNNNIVELIYLNTEQITRSNIQSNIIILVQKLLKIKEKYTNVNVSIMDYSNENIEILKNNSKFLHLSTNLYYDPYQYNLNEINRLKLMSSNNTNYHDIVFCGAMSNYRNNILNNISKNIKYKRIIGWNKIRDEQIGKSLLLLNIHYNESYNIYESIRCDRWIFAGKLILTEKSLNSVIIDVKDCMVICEYKNLLETLNDILNNYEEYMKKYIYDNDDKIQQIILNRQKIYEEFRNKFN